MEYLALFSMKLRETELGLVEELLLGVQEVIDSNPDKDSRFFLCPTLVLMVLLRKHVCGQKR